ncbi:MAG: peptide/nickel transport system substrate-binding protein [Streptosporangiaceae bacterium]|jgi:peptide/nickel transport system substrate-binding protein|nr:peptide/nickel transport system substrate-binding protein [Streptosporangiaceae bacterium]
MRKRTRGYGAVVGLAALALAVAACGGSTAKPGTSPTGTTAGFQGLNPGTGTPKKGGTLNMLGQGDVDFMDPNISYYTIGGLGQRMWIRGLYAYAAIPGKTTLPSPDLATAAPTVSNGGKSYAVTIRSGAQWDTSPARPVTAADALLGLKRSCNPVQPFGGLPDFETLIAGYQAFCTDFAKLGSTATVAAIKSFINSHQISGVTVSGQTITYTLVHPASYFGTMLTLDPFNPAPAESLNYIPASAASQQHPIADGPYTVQSYVPTRSIVFVRNPAWKASSDPIRKAYVDKIVVSETGNQPSVQQQLQTNTSAAGMEFDAFPPVAATAGLISQMNAGLNHNFNLGPTYSSNPYVVYNQVSPNNGGALAKVAVRQAINYGINRSHLIQDAGGASVSPPLTHIVPPGINGSQDLPSGYDPYPLNLSKAKSLLASAGYKNGLNLTLLYRPSSTIEAKMVQTLQSDLAKIGVKIKLLSATPSDFYTKYLEVPTAAKSGVWDIALAGWGPDWYGDAAVSFFGPLYSGPASYPPNGSNFGFYSDPAVTSLIAQGAKAATSSAAATIWAQADQKIMQDAVIYPITDPQQPLYHASYVHNAVYIPAVQQLDPTNVWLSTP